MIGYDSNKQWYIIKKNRLFWTCVVNFYKVVGLNLVKFKETANHLFLSCPVIAVGLGCPRLIRISFRTKAKEYTILRLFEKVKVHSLWWMQTNNVNLSLNSHLWWSSPLVCLGIDQVFWCTDYCMLLFVLLAHFVPIGSCCFYK
jgi:hypothetical protein